MEIIKQPWPWYTAGVLLGMTVPILLLLGNKKFGISSSFRQICAACVPAGLSFFQYDWKKDAWNLFFVAGIVVGAFLATTFLADPSEVVIAPETVAELKRLGVTEFKGLLPSDVFSWQQLLTLRGFVMMAGGGFLVGFGTRYAGGCTSGHTLMGLSNLQLPSLVATICFMIGGFVMTHLILPFILAL